MRPLSGYGSFGGLNVLGSIESEGPEYVDFTTYSVTDPNNNLTVEPQTLTFNNITSNTNERIWSDIDLSPSSNDLTVQYTLNVSDAQQYAFIVLPCFQEDADTPAEQNTYGAGSCFRAYQTGIGNVTYQQDNRNPSFFYGKNTGIDHFIEVSYSAGSFTTSVYDDPEYSNSLASSTMSYDQSRSLQYFYPLTCLNSGFNNPGAVTGEIRDLTLISDD